MKASSPKKKHPWRKCPLGEHWISEHERSFPISKTNPDGTTLVDGHCRKNPSRHEIFTSDEIREMSALNFKKLKTLPKHDPLGFPKGNDFDTLIGGWTQFWNEVLNPSKPLDPNLVKALVASESGFRTFVDIESKAGRAKGLIQITEQTRKILSDQEGELRDHLITLSQKDVLDPSLNLFSGIRWLFRKKELATHRLKREATWMEAIAEYKGILGQLGTVKKADEIMETLNGYYMRLNKK